MRIDDDVVQALEALGYEVEHIAPSDDDPGYTRATKGKEFIDMQKCVRLEVTRFADIVNAGLTWK